MLASHVAAQTEEPPPAGFDLGGVILAPSLIAGYAYDSNIFLQSPDEAPPGDQVMTLQPAVLLTVPFSNSYFRFGDTLRWQDYQKTAQNSGKTSNEAMAELELNFGTLDSLSLSARNVSGVAETLAFDPGGEVVFDGKSYTFHNEAIAVAREVVGARGYRVGLERNALHFDRTTDIYFFDYSGFDGEAMYFQPLSSNTSLGFGYLGTRYDHFDTSPGSNPYEPYRTESGDTLEVSLEGRLGPRQPYHVRLGWEELDFAGNDAPDFSGIVGRGDLSVIVGGGTILTVSAQRQPYRSFFGENNFYVFDQIGLSVNRLFTGGTSIGGNANYVRNAYEVPVPTGGSGPSVVRTDRAIWLEVYANLAMRERVAFRFSIRENRKSSNYPGADYDETVVFGGLVFGWF